MCRSAVYIFLSFYFNRVGSIDGSTAGLFNEAAHESLRQWKEDRTGNAYFGCAFPRVSALHMQQRLYVRLELPWTVLSFFLLICAIEMTTIDSGGKVANPKLSKHVFSASFGQQCFYEVDTEVWGWTCKSVGMPQG
jgi:hypothetical protein